MSNAEVLESHPLRAFEREPEGGFPESEVSLFLARSGVGKSAALINFAIDSMLAGNRVFHFSVGMTSDKVHQYYEEIYQEYRKAYQDNREMDDWNTLNHRLMVISYRDADKMIDDLEPEIQTIATSAHLEPALIIVDGLDFGPNSTHHLKLMAESAKTHEVKILSAMTVHRTADGCVDVESPHQTARHSVRRIYFLDPVKNRIKLEALGESLDQTHEMPIYFNPGDLLFYKI